MGFTSECGSKWGFACEWEGDVNGLFLGGESKRFFRGGGGKILFLWCLGKGVEG